jgi:hypothetical protein
MSLLLSILVPAAGLAAMLAAGVTLLHLAAGRRHEPVAGFDCPEWIGSEGTCCPDGAVRPDCPQLQLQAGRALRARRTPLHPQTKEATR